MALLPSVHNQAIAPFWRIHMPATPENCRINYIELNVRDIEKAKAFYGKAFGWTFTDYGPQYAEFSDGAMKGGLTSTEQPSPAGGPLVILYAEQLEAAQTSVQAAGGNISHEIFAFPGGRRFHFKDADGYELAVWSKN
jgi:predicted enzyme related to lactoylglutathione lyase